MDVIKSGDIASYKKLRYVSVFSGIEAVSCALDFGAWEPVAFSEIEPFPCAVLKHHYPDVPNLGDITKIDWKPYVGSVDVVWGGSPCQSFSIAGNREGLKGASGLMFEFIRCVRELCPRWFVWENVPGALSSESGHAFGQLLSEMDERGYGLAWRILDAQYFGVPQRRERVFLVGSLGDMRCAEVLFEREGMPWNPSPRREKRKALAGESARRAGTSDRGVGDCLTPGENQSRRVYSTGSAAGSLGCGDVTPTLKTDHSPAVALDFHQQDGRIRVSGQPDVSATITASAGTGGNNVPMVMCRADTQSNAPIGYDLAPTLMAHASHDPPIICPSPASKSIETIRRLTPEECERLQGFPDGWTDVPYRGKDYSPDGSRYKALGNSMAVPVIAWIANRIKAQESRKKVNDG